LAANRRTKTQQPTKKSGRRNGGEHEGVMRQAGRVGEAQCHHFGGVVSWIGDEKKMSSLVINFFLGRSAELNKTLAHCPHPTPSKEAPMGGGGLIHHIHAAVAVIGATMVTCFFGWLKRQSTIKNQLLLCGLG
jgi:hypothetical protein